MNYYARTARKTLHSQEIDTGHSTFRAFQDLLDKLEAIGILEIKNNRLKFHQEADRFYSNGGWLEQYVYATVNTLKKTIPTIQDTVQSVEIHREGKNIKNELDIAFLCDNRLHLIECKTKNFQKNPTSGAETIYKLDSLADTIGGLNARAMLLSFKPLQKYDAQRAKDLHIKVLHGEQLKQLPEHLKQWIQPTLTSL